MGHLGFGMMHLPVLPGSEEFCLSAIEPDGRGIFGGRLHLLWYQLRLSQREK